MPDTNDNQLPVLILGALRHEMNAIIKRLNLQRARGSFSRYEGTFASIPIIVKIAGIGSTSLLGSLNRLLDEEEIGSCILAGYSGGLQPELMPGALVLPQWIIDTGGGAISLAANVPKHYEQAPEGRLANECILTSEDLVGSSSAKREAAQKYKVAAVDLESYAVAKRAAEIEMPFRVIRAVCDPASFDMPAEALEWIRPDGSQDIGAVARYLVSHPSQTGNLVRLANYAQQASLALADGVVETLSQDLNRVG